MKKHFMIILTGIAIGVAAIVLVRYGNPGNMGFCIACFLRDIAGALKLHTVPVVQYMRPEILGLVLGAFVMALLFKEFKPVGGSAVFSRFVLGFFVMIGALVFLGCPLRMFLRLGAWRFKRNVRFSRFYPRRFSWRFFSQQRFFV